MNTKEIFKLPQAEQEKWLLENSVDFYDLMMSGEHIGLLIQANEDDIKDNLDNPGREEIDNFIETYYPEITRQRADEIRAGATVTDQEKTVLIKAAALEKFWGDTEGYVRTVCPIQILGENVFVTFSSMISGQWSELNFDNIYKSKEEALKAIETLSTDEYLFDM
ncbi:hypothetical protein ACMAY8_16565 [Rhodobacteraceae bacterium nBUS_22]